MKNKTMQKAVIFAVSILTHANRIIPFFSLCDHVFRRLGLIKVKLFLITGAIKNTNYSTTILFIGKGISACEQANYFASIVFSQVERLVYFGEFLHRQVNTSDFKNVEIIVVDPSIETSENLLEQGFMLLPAVNFGLDLTCSMNDLTTRFSRRRMRSIKKIRSLNYSYVISRNNEKNHDFFYWRMYLPYIRRRFGGGAQPNSYQTSKTVYRKNGGIIFVLEENKPISGILFFVKNKTVHAVGLGVYQSDENYLKNSACEAALFFLIKWSKTQGLKSLNYGGTVPFFTNGVFQYKKEWGMLAEEKTDQIFCALKIVSLNEECLSCLLHNPFIFLDKNEMKGLVFANHRLTQTELQKLFSTYAIPKMDSLMVISYYDEKTREKAEADLALKSQRTPIALGKALSTICSSFLKRGFNVDVFWGKAVPQVVYTCADFNSDTLTLGEFCEN
jgi:hypothetical protein